MIEDVPSLDEGFRALAGLLVDAEPIDATLHRVASITARTFGPGTLVSVTLAGDPPRTVAASDDAAAALDEHQREAGEGPCAAALATAEVVVARPDDAKYPALRASLPPWAAKHTIAALPLLVGGSVAGALNVYAEDPELLAEGEIDAALALAAQAAVSVSNARSYDECRDRVAQLQGALDSRVVIEQAKGVFMERYRCDADAAFERLRQDSQHANRKLRDIASEVVASTTSRRLHPRAPLA